MNRIEIKEIEDERYLILALLNLGTLALYWPVDGFNFVNLDDPEYVMTNPMVPAIRERGRSVNRMTTFTGRASHD